MKFPVMAAVVLGCVVLAQPSMAQTSCSEAFAACQKPQGDRCDVVCKAYCAKQKKACLKTGSFQTKSQRWTALEKK